MTEMELKKISFGFSKTTNKSVINTKPVQKEETIELIKCLEGKEIKLMQEKKPKELLVIPLKNNKSTSAALASLLKRRAVLENKDIPEEKKPDAEKSADDDNISLEQRAARELLSEVTAEDSEENNNKNLVLPVLQPDELPLDGAKEPSIEDYEDIPIQDYGRAMLRGMGWVDPPPEKDIPSNIDIPMPRPKGMGLGADKAIKPQPLLVPPEKNEVLKVKKQAFVRILAGKHKDMYGQVQGFDDHAERVIVKMAIGGVVEVFNEFMCQPVAKKEYEQYSKCINTVKYEAYKKMENEHGQIIINKDTPSSGKAEREDCKDIKQERDKKYRKRESDSGSNEYSHREFTHKKQIRGADTSSIESTNLPHKDSTGSKEHKHRQNRSSREGSDLVEQSSSSSYKKYFTDWGSTISSTERNDNIEQASSSSHRKRVHDYSSSECSSDSDVSEHHRKHKRKSHKSPRSTHSKKSKKSKSKRCDYSTESQHSSDVQSHKKKHKKKTKKSRRPRSRSRSRK